MLPCNIWLSCKAQIKCRLIALESNNISMERPFNALVRHGNNVILTAYRVSLLLDLLTDFGCTNYVETSYSIV